jgi:hypothetical protein
MGLLFARHHDRHGLASGLQADAPSGFRRLSVRCRVSVVIISPTAFDSSGDFFASSHCVQY